MRGNFFRNALEHMMAAREREARILVRTYADRLGLDDARSTNKGKKA